jgi:hypothetical protein
MAAALEHGPRGLVQQLILATEHALHHRAALCTAALATIDAPADRLAVHQAHGAVALINAVAAFPSSQVILHGALVALNKVWAGGLPPYDAPCVPTERIVASVLDVMVKWKGDLLVTQATLRLLSLHTRSATQLVKAPQVIAAIERAALGQFKTDDVVQSYVAECVVHLNCVEPQDVLTAHGQLGYASLCEMSVKLCYATPRPAALQLGGADWQVKVLATYPKLRERARAA